MNANEGCPPPLPPQIDRYGVTLERLAAEHLELVRQWRTSPEISQFMVYQAPITSEMQLAWFSSLDPLRDLHFIISWHGDRAGLVDIKAINWTSREFVAGIFVVPAYWHTEVPLRASLCAYDFAFGELRLEAATATVLKTNTRALRFNKALGFRAPGGFQDESAPTVALHLQRSDYERVTRRLRDFLARTSDLQLPR